MKNFYLMDGIGKAKYTVNFHNGIDKHKDGSDFYGIDIFKNAIKRDRFVKTLIKEGYVER